MEINVSDFNQEDINILSKSMIKMLISKAVEIKNERLKKIKECEERIEERKRQKKTGRTIEGAT